MSFQPLNSYRPISVRQAVTLGFVGMLLLGGLAGVIGSVGVAAAQQGNGDKTITKSEFRNWVHQIDKASKSRAKKLVENNPKKAKILKRVGYRVLPMGYPQGVEFMLNNKPKKLVSDILSEVDVIRVPQLPADDGEDSPPGKNPPGNGTPPENGTSPGNSTPENPVNATIHALKKQKLGWGKLGSEQKKRVRQIFVKMHKKDLSQSEQNGLFKELESIFPGSRASNPIVVQERKSIIEKKLGASPGFSVPDPIPDLNIPSIIDLKLDAFADSAKQAAADILTNLYNLAFKTPVPENNGWKGILGTPVDTKANEVFHDLFQQLLVDKLYPVTYSLLTIGILFMAFSFMRNPFMSHHQVVDYFIKLALAIMYWAFAWTGVTLLHGTVNGITMWLRPSPAVMGELVTSVEALSAGAVAAYFAGSGGMLATLFALGIELGMRRVLLLYFFPYIFPALVLILYLSPWQRLKSYMSMLIWQYVNVLVMVIPMAILLKAAAIVSLELKSKPPIVSMFILVALFVVAAAIPAFSTWFFLQVPGKTAKAVRSAKGRGKSAVGSAYSGGKSVGGTARDKLGWGGDGSAGSGSASSGGNTSTSTEEAVESAIVSDGGTVTDTTATDTSTGTSTSDTSTESTGLPSSGTVDSMPDTVAGKMRELHDRQTRDPMNADSMKEAYFGDYSRQYTLSERMAD